MGLVASRHQETAPARGRAEAFMGAWCYSGRLALFLSRRAKAASPNGLVVIDREALAVEREQVVGVRPDSSTKPVRWLCSGLPQSGCRPGSIFQRNDRCCPHL